MAGSIIVKPELQQEIQDRLLADACSILGLEIPEAKALLDHHRWDIQKAIDAFLGQTNSDDDADNEEFRDEPTEEPNTSSRSTAAATVTLPPRPTEVSRWAPEQLSILSWNLDGLDEHNLERRMDAVIALIESERFDVVFLQELLPTTFEYIASRIKDNYLPIPGTENPNCDYFVGTFLRNYRVYYTNHRVVAFPNSQMDRNVLVTEAFMGKAKLKLLNTHLESTAEFAEERKAQLTQCFELCMTLFADTKANIIFGGDLNLRDREVDGKIPANMTDLWVRCGSRPSARFTWDLTRNTNKQMPGPHQPRCRFDRLYFLPSDPETMIPQFFGVTGIEKVQGTQSFPSDHWGIVSYFRLTEEARKPEAEGAEGGAHNSMN